MQIYMQIDGFDLVAWFLWLGKIILKRQWMTKKMKNHLFCRTVVKKDDFWPAASQTPGKAQRHANPPPPSASCSEL
jgi:hypothetical protein